MSNRGEISLDEERSIYNTPDTTLTLDDSVDNNIPKFDVNASFINAEGGLPGWNANVKPGLNISAASLSTSPDSTLNVSGATLNSKSESDRTLNASDLSVSSSTKRKFDETVDEDTDVTSDTTSPMEDSAATSGSFTEDTTLSVSTPTGPTTTKDTAESSKAESKEQENSKEKTEGVYDEYSKSYLPRTVSILTAPKGCKVYLVGTVHFSRESHEDVSKVIQAVQPHVVLVELCNSRIGFLELDEEAVLQAVNLSFSTVVDIMREKGVVNGMLFVLLLSLSARITKMLKMAPGGEFRRALKEAEKVPGCKFVLGDRPLSVTVQRVVASLSWWMTIRLWWNLLTSLGEEVSADDIEKLKHSDLLEELLKELSKDFPDVGNVFVVERDIYIAHHLQMLARPIKDENGEEMPTRVVGVVGIGHAAGIASKLGKVTTEDVLKIIVVPPPSMTGRVLRVTIRASILGLVVYGVTRIVPVHRMIPSASQVKSFVQATVTLPLKKYVGSAGIAT